MTTDVPPTEQVLDLGSDDLRLGLAPLGARVHRLRARDGDGTWRDVVLGLPRVADNLDDDAYLGASVGRYANRIARGELVVDGATHALPTNDRGHTLHGGPDGFDRRTWTVVEAGERSAELELVSPDGDQGFPGTVTVRARFEVTGRTLRTSYAATTDAPTVVSLTSHAYYRLGGQTAADHELILHADAYLPVEDGVPTGEVADVTGTRFDLRAGGPPGDLDHPFVVRGCETGWTPGGPLREVARLRAHGLRLTIAADQPGVQVYTGGLFDGRFHPRFAGVAIEPQLHPDSPHHEGEAGWPSAVLRPGGTYRWTSEVTVDVDPAGPR
ncbi:aldose epimerase family protein [Nocardioides sp. SOB77]|uniref:Aldose epimerase family protein n=1 Tax=Nocardioides oceani TaxID=3058369 RepID=A0ABT8FAX1_9ACTN|nr:aldose epimerase family protein [Nocardioides oceani]MDN4171843.1 aldose epimerase family protein [Nocardioides oceani]